MTPTFKPSLREVLPSTVHEHARVTLTTQREALTHTPWFIRVLIGGGAWMASLFLLIFLSLAMDVMKDKGLAVLGLLLIAGATGMRRAEPGLFLEQAALALGLAGQGLFVFGVAEVSHERVTALAVFVLEAVLLLVSADLIQRFLSACAASVALLYALHDGLPVVLGLVAFCALAHELLLRQASLEAGPWGERATLTAHALLTVILTVLLFIAADAGGLDANHPEVMRALLTLGLAAVTLVSAWRVLAESHAAPGGAAGVTLFVALSLTTLLTFHLPGFITAVGALMLGLHRRSVVLVGLAVVALLAFGVSYYYDLDLTLLAKSLALVGGGLVLLGLRLFVLRRFPLSAEVP